MEIIEWLFNKSEGIRNLALVIAAVFALFLARWRGKSAQDAADSAVKNAKTAEKTQVTNSFTAAITQLGDENLSIRLGGIYALKKIAEENPESYKDVVGNTLQAFIRSTSKYELTGEEVSECINKDELKEKVDELNRKLIKDDIAAALASLVGIGIKKISLSNTVLNGCNLKKANLEGANLVSANIKWANLEGAILYGADLYWAKLEGANLKGAKLGGANLESAVLRGAKNLTVHQLLDARSIGDIRLDFDLQEELDKVINENKILRKNKL